MTCNTLLGLRKALGSIIGDMGVSACPSLVSTEKGIPSCQPSPLGVSSSGIPESAGKAVGSMFVYVSLCLRLRSVAALLITVKDAVEELALCLVAFVCSPEQARVEVDTRCCPALLQHGAAVCTLQYQACIWPGILGSCTSSDHMDASG